jgi:hypothetical protein
MRVLFMLLLTVTLSPSLLLAQTDSDTCNALIEEMFEDQNSLIVPSDDESQNELVAGYVMAMVLRQKYEDIDAGDCSEIGFSGPRVASYFASVQDAFALLLFQQFESQPSDDWQELLEDTQERIDSLGRELIFGLF